MAQFLLFCGQITTLVMGRRKKKFNCVLNGSKTNEKTYLSLYEVMQWIPYFLMQNTFNWLIFLYILRNIGRKLAMIYTEKWNYAVNRGGFYNGCFEYLFAWIIEYEMVNYLSIRQTLMLLRTWIRFCSSINQWYLTRSREMWNIKHSII